MYWLTQRSMGPTLTWIAQKLGARPVVAEANTRALKAGYAFGETTEMFHTTYRVPKARLDPGTYRVAAWHERLPGGERSITLAADLIREIDAPIGVNALPKVE
jgi:2-oxoglutarate ferredoxin oxidoreductase subunit alpha